MGIDAIVERRRGERRKREEEGGKGVNRSGILNAARKEGRYVFLVL